MGLLPSVHHDQPSVLEPGMKSCLSDSLDLYVIDFPAFFQSIVGCWRDPFYDKWKLWASKSIELENVGREDFSLRITWDGARSRQLGYGDGQDFTYKALCRVNAAEKLIDFSMYAILTESQRREIEERGMAVEEDEEGFGLTDTFHMRFLAHPLRLEVWRMHMGQRLSGEFLSAAAKNCILAGILQQRAEVKVFSSVVSLDGGGLCIVSEELDEKLPYEAFWEAIKDIMRRQLQQGQQDVRVSEISETEFEMSFVTGIPDLELMEKRADAPERLEQQLHFKLDPENGDLFIVGRGGEGQHLIFTDFAKAHRDPFRIEAWTVLADGRRIATNSLAILWQLVLHTMVSNLGSQWIF